MILIQHIPLISKILNIDGFLADPVLSFGYQDVVLHEKFKSYFPDKRPRKEDLKVYLKLRDSIAARTSNDRYEVCIPWRFMEADFNQVLRNHGARDIITLDLFDERSDLKHDMNLSISKKHKGQFNTVIDIGSTEHVFDTRQCLENLFNMLSLNGHILFHLPCNGCFDHGFHTFSPEAIIESLRLNGFKIKFIAYSLEPEGIEMGQPVVWSDCILWCVAQKIENIDHFRIPQQKGCQAMYGLTEHPG